MGRARPARCHRLRLTALRWLLFAGCSLAPVFPETVFPETVFPETRSACIPDLRAATALAQCSLVFQRRIGNVVGASDQPATGAGLGSLRFPLASTLSLMQIDLSDTNALVTGGTRGIGRAIVDALADAGARVAFTYRSSTDAADALVDALHDRGTDALALQGDVADFDTAQAHVDAVLDAWGSLDVLVNNAGVTRDGLMLRMQEDDWDTVLDVNLKGVFNFAKAAYRPFMRQRAGRMINISSVVGVTGNPGQTNYAASKAGIIGFSKSLAKELGSRNVTVNVVAPGYVETDMTDALSDDARNAMLDAVPLSRPATPADVAHAVCFLASPAASYITGHVLHVDGGLAM